MRRGMSAMPSRTMSRATVPHVASARRPEAPAGRTCSQRAGSLGWKRQILAQHFRVPRRDPEQCQRRPFGRPSSLFPIPQRMNAYGERLREFFLCEASETPKGDDEVTFDRRMLRRLRAYARGPR